MAEGDQAEDDGDALTAGMRVEARMFLGIAAFLVVATVVYGVVSAERAGTTMLLLAAGMAVIVGGYLTFQVRLSVRADRAQAVGEGAIEADDDEDYLPHASIWPFGMGMGLVVMANGLALGMWALVPGVLLAGSSLFGYARQSRRRD